MPKAVRTYCAVISHHIGSMGKFEPPVARSLKSLASAALRNMPGRVLDDVLDSMDTERATVLRRLRRRPAVTEKAAAA